MARQVGRLVWIGLYPASRSYGFIYQPNGKVAARVDRDTLGANVQLIAAPETAVTFTSERFAGHTHPQARDVALLKDEDDWNLISQCFHNSDPLFWMAAAPKFLSEEPAHLSLVAVRKKLADGCDVTNMLDVTPDEVLLLPEARDLRLELTVERRLRLYEDLPDAESELREIDIFLHERPTQTRTLFWHKRLSSVSESDQLERYFMSSIEGLWQEAAGRLFDKLPEDHALWALGLIRKKLASMRDGLSLLRFVPDTVLHLPVARDVRALFIVEHRALIYLSIADLTHIKDEVIAYLPQAPERYQSDLRERLVANETDVDQLVKYFHDPAPAIWQRAAPKLFHRAKPEQVLEQISVKLASLKDASELVRYVPDRVLRLTEARYLWQYLPADRRLDLYATLEDLESVADEIERCLSLASADAASLFGLKVSERISYGGKLFRLSPVEVRREVIKREFRDLLAAIKSWPVRPPVAVSWSPSDLYSSLDDDDRALAMLWAKGQADSEDVVTDYITAQMMSARAAEKATSWFYQSLGHRVKDVSIQQVKGQGNEWVNHDLLRDDLAPIDVKNSRTAVNNKTGYVDHWVPRFKTHKRPLSSGRKEVEVIIAGVLSPYLQLKYIENPDSRNFSTCDITYLGETSRSELEKLSKSFSRNGVTVESTSGTVLPPWVFEFPERFYQEREARRKALLSRLSRIPSVMDMSLFDDRLLPALLAAGIQLSAGWREALPKWQTSLYDVLLTRSPITLPVLFLTLLNHFIEMVMTETPDPGYRPTKYQEILYMGEKVDRKLPVGVYDPLAIIDNFCQTLDILWGYRQQEHLSQYRYFKFIGLGILRGQRDRQDAPVSLLAYCGGRLQGKGKCGNSPLVIGREPTCHSCGMLICPRCGCCLAEPVGDFVTTVRRVCPECKPRMAEYARRNLETQENPSETGDIYLTNSSYFDTDAITF